MTERAQIGEVTLAYERREGSGPTVVFVHGLGGRKEAWREQLRAAAEAGRDAVAVDLRGAGESEVPPGRYSAEGWAHDLVAFLEALGIERAALVGHSVGCMVVEHAALALQERCMALGMLGGALAWEEGFRSVLAERAELARAGRLREVGEAVAAAGLTQGAHAERPDLVARLVEMLESNDPRGYAESALATGRASMLDPERVECPALAFAGAEDPVTPVGAAEEIAAAMPRGEFAAVPGGAHWCLLEVPGAVTEVLLGFLDRTTG